MNNFSLKTVNFFSNVTLAEPGGGKRFSVKYEVESIKIIVAVSGTI